MQQIPPQWLQQLDEVIALLDEQSGPNHEERLVERLTTLDPDLLAFLAEQLAAQQTPQAATLFEKLAAESRVPDQIRERARAALGEFARHGIHPVRPGEESFYAGFVQEGRERGEQILALGWRLPGGSLEALVFLLDWRGDGLKDYYRTRDMTEAEWDELIAHNAEKGAPMTQLSLLEAKALVEAGLAESRRFSRPLPRDYRLDATLVERRLPRSIEAPAPDALRTFITASLSPEDIVQAYITALHYRDYTLAALLLAPEHELRSERSVSETAEALRLRLKHAPRRDAEAQTRLQSPDATQLDAAANAIVAANGVEVIVERSGKRVRRHVGETYRLSKVSQTWKIVAIESANQV